ncbi:MAG: hypothetical protein AB4426_24125 [Xenococcaceae cyanobacterium]
MVGNEAWLEYAKTEIEKAYPNLPLTGYEITSPDTIDYNCIAWAAGDQESWWWPDKNEQDYWPPGIKREETLPAFIDAFQTIGYELCESESLEEEFEKVAIYIDENSKPKHAARQLPNGKWTSKLGNWEDIEHESLDGLVGEYYGTVAQIMKRPMGANLI